MVSQSQPQPKGLRRNALKRYNEFLKSHVFWHLTKSQRVKFVTKGMDIKGLVEIVILRYDH